jgi:hemolysin III
MTDLHKIREELWNAITHGLGAVLSVAGGSVLITLAAMKGNSWQLISAIVFTMALILLYTASTLYHAIPHLNAKQQLKVFDHCAIYVLIAGTYTPFTLIGMHGYGGWWLFGISWILALAGVLFKLFYTGRFKLISTLIYLGMGWMVIFAIKPMLSHIDIITMSWLLIGGLFYTLGTIFYLSNRIPYAHAIWHVFVMLGSASHFVAVSMQILL